MVKRIIVIGLLSLVVAFNSYAQDSDRIDQLEKEIQELKLRVLKLESVVVGKAINTHRAVCVFTNQISGE